MPSEVCLKVANAYRVDRRNEFCARQFNDVRLALETLQLRPHVFASGANLGRTCHQIVTYINHQGSWPPPTEAGWGYGGVIGDTYFGALEVTDQQYFEQGLSIPTLGHKRIVDAVWSARWFRGEPLSNMPSGAVIDSARLEITLNAFTYRNWQVNHTSYWFGADENDPPNWASSHVYERITTPPLEPWEPPASGGTVMLIAVGEKVGGNIHALGWSESFYATSGQQVVVNITDVAQALVTKSGSIYKNIGLLATGPYWDYGVVNGDSATMKAWLPSASSPLLLINPDGQGSSPPWGCCVCQAKGVEYDYSISVTSHIHIDFTLPSSLASRRISYPANLPSMT